MSQPAGGGVRAPLPAPEQLAEWRRLVDRLAHGDDAAIVPWEEVLYQLGLA